MNPSAPCLILLTMTLAGLNGCTQQQPAKPAALPIALPPSAAPDPALLPLSFMAGRWIAVNPNKTLNEEHWTEPRGNNMAALFKQNRRDGKPALFEVSLITATSEGVTLVLRHLHAGLEVPERRKELSVFRLVSAGDDRAEFTGTGAAAQVSSVVYRRSGPDELTVEVVFAPESRETGYTTVYHRQR